MKKNKTKFISALIILVAIIAAYLLFFNPQNNNSGNIIIDPTTAVQEDSKVVTFTIDVHVLNSEENNEKLNDAYKKYVDESGYIIKDLKVELKEDATVAEVLDAISKEKSIPVVYEEMSAFKYVSSINNLDAGILGDYSGWMFTVNGEFPTQGVEEVNLKDGDVVTFVFTADGGNDVANQ